MSATKPINISSNEASVLKWCASSYGQNSPIVVQSGGTSSGKTYSILKYLSSHWAYRNGLVITVAGQDIPNLKKGAYRDFQNIIEADPFLQQELSFHNRSNREFESNTGSTIEFNSYDDSQDAKSGKRDFLFVNEANGLKYEVFEELQVRTSQQVIIDFNPTARFWAHDRLKPREDVDWYDSTFRDNPFIQDSILSKILEYEPTPENIARGTANKYRWQVYGLGKVGRLEGLVFPGFETTSEWPDEYKWRVFGLDFGFTNDPSALVEVRYAHGELYCKQLMYDTGLTNPDIANELFRLKIDTDQRIIADSAEPKSIEELRRKGFNIIGAIKGKDSINQGIDAMKRYPIKVFAGSKDLVEEFSSYQWKEDRDGKATNKPIDDFNHGIDSIRYALSDKLIRGNRKKKRRTRSHSKTTY